MTGVFEPVRAARLAWERTQPQLFFEFPQSCVGDQELTAAADASRAVSSPSTTSPYGGRRPDASTTQRTKP